MCESSLKRVCRNSNAENDAVVRVRTSGFPTLTHDRVSSFQTAPEYLLTVSMTVNFIHFPKINLGDTVFTRDERLAA
jgi:hypothetical protein